MANKKTEFFAGQRLILIFIIVVIFGYSLIFIMFYSNNEWRTILLEPPAKNLSNAFEINQLISDLLDCQRIFDGDYEYAIMNRFYMSSDPNESEMPMDCPSIWRRNPSLEEGISTETDEQRDYPLAFARVVYMDYLLLEMELAANYAPQNWYCYAVDLNADPLFRSRMHQLAACFPNVFITRREFTIQGVGHNTSDAMMECARELADPDREWHYLVTLQNHDIQAKTNAEMVQIFKWLDGANDIEIGQQSWSTIQERVNYYKTNFPWTFSALNLFKNDKKNGKGSPQGSPPPTVHLSKGYSAASLSRAFINFIVFELNLDKMLTQLNKATFGVDEHLWQTLSTTDALNPPGGFPQQCYDWGFRTPYITRYALWAGDDQICRSANWRHSVCVFGIEDLLVPVLMDLPHLFVNKMMPDSDFGVIKCWHHWMHQKRLNHSERHLDPKLYTNWPQTKYNQLRRLGSNTAEINCTLYF